MKVKYFHELSCRELYEILRLRSEVFILEQGGRYQDLDGIDYESIHIFLEEGDTVTGCIRIFPKEDEPGTVQLGRLVSRTRNQGVGRALMEKAEEIARDAYSAERLYLTGRRSAMGFYEKLGYERSLPEEYISEKEAMYFIFRKEI